MTLRRKFPGDGVQHAEFLMSARVLPAEEFAERGVRLKDDDEKKPKLYEMAISSEAEIDRWFGIEVLGHAEGEVDRRRLERGMAVLIDHRGDQVGLVEPGSFRVGKDNVGRVLARFSESQRGQEVERDVATGIRVSVSIGYRVMKAKLVEQREVGKDREGNPIRVDVWRITQWQPMEVSLVSVPADTTVGVGREASGRAEPPVETEDGVAVREERTMKKKKVRADDGAIIEVNEDDPREAVREEPPVQPKGQTVRDRNAEITEILGMCATNKVAAEKSRKWIEDGLSADQVARAILAEHATKGEAQPAAETIGNVLGKDRKRYSYIRAVRVGAGLHPRVGETDFRGQKPDGLEWETHCELLKTADESRYHGGLLVPVDLRTDEDRVRDWYEREYRTLDAKTITKGTEVVFERPGELIELLRNRAMVLRLGARMLSGLQGPVAFPKQTGGMTVYWVGENPGADVTASDIALGLVNLAPKTLQGTTGYTRQLLAQSSIDVEMMVRNEFAVAHALALDRSAIHGLGAAGEPTGVYKAPDVNVRAVGGAPDWDDVIVAETEVAVDNADLGSLGWLTTPGMAGKLMRVLVAAAAGSEFIWVGTFREGRMGGYPAVATNQVSSLMTGSEATGGTEHGAVFGNWNDLIFGTWAAMELIVDPFAQKKRGLVEVTSFQMADLILRHGESFVKWTGATAV